jgi:hypothetical protein
VSGRKESINALIERSSLGSQDAKAARSRIPHATARSVVKSAMSASRSTTSGRSAASLGSVRGSRRLRT